MKEGIRKLKSSKNVCFFADKTTNIYKVLRDKSKKLLKENIMKTYRKLTPRLEEALNLEAKQIAKKLELDDRIECLAKTPAFITLKDYKDNFHSSHPCCLLNPCKSELRKVSKIILEKINVSLVEKLKLNQWKTSDSVISWLKAIEEKQKCLFI